MTTDRRAPSSARPEEGGDERLDPRGSSARPRARAPQRTSRAPHARSVPPRPPRGERPARLAARPLDVADQGEEACGRRRRVAPRVGVGAGQCAHALAQPRVADEPQQERLELGPLGRARATPGPRRPRAGPRRRRCPRRRASGARPRRRARGATEGRPAAGAREPPRRPPPRGAGAPRPRPPATAAPAGRARAARTARRAVAARSPGAERTRHEDAAGGDARGPRARPPRGGGPRAPDEVEGKVDDGPSRAGAPRPGRARTR